MLLFYYLVHIVLHLIAHKDNKYSQMIVMEVSWHIADICKYVC